VSLAVRGTTVVGEFSLELDLGLPRGTCAVVGDNGVGKTTLLRTVAGLSPLVSGCSRLDDEVLDEPAARRFVAPRDRGVAMLFQDPMLFPFLDVLDNAAFGLVRRGTQRESARARALEWLGRFGVDDLVARRVDTLSGGQAQRVALARAFAVVPRIVLLDEPFASLDRRSRIEFRALLAAHLATLPVVTLVVTHDDADVSALCASTIEVVRSGAASAVARQENVA